MGFLFFSLKPLTSIPVFCEGYISDQTEKLGTTHKSIDTDVIA